MASSANQSSEQVEKVSLKVMVDKVTKKVVYAEAGKDFVDVLFSFLTLPLGTIARLVDKESNIEAVQFGSISSLYQSVTDLDQQYLWSQTCKEMLQQPRNSMEGYCHRLKLNIDDTPMKYFQCRTCGRLTTFISNQNCLCGSQWCMYAPRDLFPNENGFVMETATFIIHDDLRVIPNDLVKSLSLLQMNGINDFVDIEREMLLISKKEVVDLLKLSLLSKTPLTDFIFKNKEILCKPMSHSKIRIEKTLPYEGHKKILMKLLVRKSTRNILFATAEEDFADFLFSFLTFPLGGVLQMLEGLSSLSCIDILYKSMTELSPDRCLRSHELKDKLSKPQIFPNFEVRNQILPIKTAMLTSNYRLRHLEFIVPKSSLSGGFVRRPLTIMVTDDLVVTPMSSFDGVSYLERMKVGNTP